MVRQEQGSKLQVFKDLEHSTVTSFVGMLDGSKPKKKREDWVILPLRFSTRVLDIRMFQPQCWNHQRLLHGRNIRSAQDGFHLMQLIGLHRLVIGLNQQFHAEGIVLIFFQMADRFLIFLLIHQQCALCAFE